MMDEEVLAIVHRYISIEWARKTLEHDLKSIQKAGLKYPALFEEAAVQVLNRLSIQMRDLKKVMRDKEIKMVFEEIEKVLHSGQNFDIINRT